MFFFCLLGLWTMAAWGSAQFTLWSFDIIVTPSCVTEATSLKGNYMSKASIINLHYDLVVSDAIDESTLVSSHDQHGYFLG